jgi:FkbM family methyltransferase
MNIQALDEHSLDVDLLKPGSVVLDVGCRTFGLAKHLASQGCKVISLDPDPSIADPAVPGVVFVQKALVHELPVGDKILFVPMHDASASFVINHGLIPGAIKVEATTIEKLSQEFGVSQWDAVKFDCEGSEYGILMTWPGPIAKQISVEFHEHVQARGESTIEAIVRHLSKWYQVQQHEKSHRHGLPINYWDSLFLLKTP